MNNSMFFLMAAESLCVGLAFGIWKKNIYAGIWMAILVQTWQTQHG